MNPYLFDPSKGLLDEFQKLAASKQRMAVPQTRSGRRSMRVDTLLRKDRDGTLFKKHWHDHLPGGLADNKKPQDFDPKALAEGEKVEREHTSNPHIAEEITMDHLTEHPGYYPALRRMEAKLEGKEKRAGLGDILKTPIPGTRDWVVNTSKRPLQGMATIAKKGLSTRPPPSMSGTFRAAKQSVNPGATRTMSGVTHISEDELKRLGFGDLAKTSSVALVERLVEFRKLAYTLQGHMQVQGLPISVENRKGSVRKGVDKDGKPWRTKFEYPYGFIKNTEGKDGEEIDAYIGPNKKALNVFVVHQHKLDGKGHDEDKVFFGFDSIEEVRAAYLRHYNGVGKKLLGPISTIAVDELKRRLAEKRKHTKLASRQPELFTESRDDNFATSLLMNPNTNHSPSLLCKEGVLSTVPGGNFGLPVKVGVELNGNLLSKMGQVDIVPADRIVQYQVDAGSLELLKKHAFTSRDRLSPLPSNGNVLVPTVSPLSKRAHLDPLSTEPLLDSGDRAANFIGDFSGTKSAEVQLTHLLGGNNQSSHVPIVLDD